MDSNSRSDVLDQAPSNTLFEDGDEGSGRFTCKDCGDPLGPGEEEFCDDCLPEFEQVLSQID